jgi:Na+/melibiose symporter-like transporter
MPFYTEPTRVSNPPLQGDCGQSRRRRKRPRVTSPERALTLLLPTAIALYACFQGVQAILVPDRVEAIDAAAKVGNMAWLTVICAATGVAGLLSIGAASDATNSRFGRRAPWLAGMAGLSLIFAALLWRQRSIGGVALFYGGLWFTLNGFQAALLAVAPDRVPPRLIRRASSLFAVAAPIGGVVGVNVAAYLRPGLGYLALFAYLAMTTCLFLALAREAPFAAARTMRGRFRLQALTSFRSRDFTLAFLFRVLMFAAQFAINNYLLYVLRDYVGASALPGHDARGATGLLNAVRTVATLAAIFAGHHLAARTSRQRAFAQGYAALMALAMLAPVMSATWVGMLVFAVLGGVAMGLYAAVDLTLMTRVLPNPLTAGRDLALLVMAGATAQFIAPTLASLLIGAFGYPSLFLASAAITVAAGGVIGLLRGIE